jgi:hypothetical protein
MLHRLSDKSSVPATLLGAALLVAPAAARSAAAQVCNPPPSSNEAKLLAFYAVPIAFSPDVAAETLRAGAVRAALEVSYVPRPAEHLRHSEVCNSKGESTNLSSIFPRPRVSVGLPHGFAVEGSYLPPVTVFDAEPNMASVAVRYERPVAWTRLGAGARLLVRAHLTAGRVRGPITCAREVLSSDPADPCYGTRPSRDTYRPNMAGLEAASTWTHAAGALAVYAGTGVTWLRPRFRVGFTNGFGQVDTTRVEVDLTRVAVLGGVTWRLTPAAEVGAQLYSVPQDATTVRVSGGWRLH